MNEYDISRAFKRIENDLMDSMIRNLKRHKAEETEEGFNWEQWQALQLKDLERYRAQNRDKFTGDFSDINKRINDLLIQTSSDAYTKQEAQILKAIKAGRFTPRKKDVQFFNINDNKLNMLLERTKADFTRAEFAILRKAEDEYRQIIFDAQVYGNVTNNYAKAVDMATHDYIKNGIQCVQYKGWTDKNGKYHKGAVHDITSYSEMAIRTANKRAYLMGEGNARDEYGVHTVQVNKRNDACPLCVRYLGKVLVDDVYSGGTREEAIKLQVPTLSDAIADGFLHPNCKDMYSTYLEGISKPAVPWNREEVERIVTKYDQGQKEERAQDMVDSYRRMAKLSLDPENQARYQARADIWQDRLDELKNTPIPPVIPPVIPKPTPQPVDNFDIKDVDFTGMGQTMYNRLENQAVPYKKVEKLPKQLTETEIINKVGGGDQTKGSCVSVAFTYIANKCGLDALDFRDGISREAFSRYGWLFVSKLDGITWMQELSDTVRPTKKLMASMAEGKEYILSTGRHTSIVRLHNGKYEYLELQSPKKNGWTPFEREVTYWEGTPYETKKKYNVTDTLKNRFGVKSSSQGSCIIVDIDQYKDNDQFRGLMGYINTSESAQKKGVKGGVK